MYGEWQMHGETFQKVRHGDVKAKGDKSQRMERWSILSVFGLMSGRWQLWACIFYTLEVLCFKRVLAFSEHKVRWPLSSSDFVWRWEMQFLNQQWRKLYSETCEMSFPHLPPWIRLNCYCGWCYIATVYDFYLPTMGKLVLGIGCRRHHHSFKSPPPFQSPPHMSLCENLCIGM